jgi:hypothetical protein
MSAALVGRSLWLAILSAVSAIEDNSQPNSATEDMARARLLFSSPRKNILAPHGTVLS